MGPHLCCCCSCQPVSCQLQLKLPTNCLACQQRVSACPQDCLVWSCGLSHSLTLTRPQSFLLLLTHVCCCRHDPQHVRHSVQGHSRLSILHHEETHSAWRHSNLLPKDACTGRTVRQHRLVCLCCWSVSRSTVRSVRWAAGQFVGWMFAHTQTAESHSPCSCEGSVLEHMLRCCAALRAVLCPAVQALPRTLSTSPASMVRRPGPPLEANSTMQCHRQWSTQVNSSQVTFS